jgi:predicted metal-dependent phosphotriesterase family hydrolase
MPVMTVLGPIDADKMGVTDAHDHLHLRSPMLAGQEIDDVAAITSEALDGARSGLQTIIELTRIGLGRRPDVLRALSASSGLNIIGATGYHRDAHYPVGHWVLAASAEVLMERMTTDLLVGMHPTDWADPTLALDTAQAGVIKAGASLHEITDSERRRLIAAAGAALKTGVAVVIHTEEATCGNEITDVLVGEGLPPEQIILAHMDRNSDPAPHLELLSRGVRLVYDTIGRAKYFPDSVRIKLIEAVCAAGYGAQLLLGLDIGRASYLRVNGGWGLRHLMSDFVPQLRERVGDALVDAMLVTNPASAFALRNPVPA